MSAIDIVTNVVSDGIFVGAIALIVWLANKLVYRRRLAKALRFFNFDQDAPIRIFVSGFAHPGVKTRRVVNALELESAILLRDATRKLTRKGLLPGFVAFLSRLVGKELTYPEPIIEPAPLEKLDGRFHSSRWS